MPNRIIRDSIKTSQSLDAVSDRAERLFTRLTTEADDLGRFDAHPAVILAGCFPLKVGIWSLTMLEKHVQELVKVDCIRLYEVNGKRYGHFPSWDVHQRLRNSKSRFPEPPTVVPPHPAAFCRELPQSAAVCGKTPQVAARARGRADAETETETETETISSAPAAQPAARSLSDFDRFYQDYPKKKNRGDAERAWERLRRAKELPTIADLVAAVHRQKASEDWRKDGGKWIPYPASWLNAKGWLDETEAEQDHHIPESFDAFLRQRGAPNGET